MATFAGLATLVLVDGTRQQGIATLRSGRPEPGGPRPWSGSFRPDDPGADLVGSVGANLPIELPTGETGEVLLEAAEGADVRLRGSGPPPF